MNGRVSCASLSRPQRGAEKNTTTIPTATVSSWPRVLPEGMSFPYDFGFVPSTLGEDGDPLDVLVLMDAPVVPGCVIRARPVAEIEAKQKTKGGDWQRNDRLIAVAAHAQTHQNVQSLEDLRPHLIDEIQEFFIAYNRLRGRKFKPLALTAQINHESYSRL